MQKLTVIIPTYNEAHNLIELLPLLSWSDEIIVVDSYSNDNTIEIAKKFNAKILEREYINSANQKNWAIPQAKNEWIFLVDADERPTKALMEEIQELLRKPDLSNNPVAYWIKRDNFFQGKQIRFSGWQNDAVIRLFKRDCCRYQEKEVHAEILTDGLVGKLKGRFQHKTYKDMNHFLGKMDRYAAWSALDHDKKTGKITLYHLYLKPAFRFFKHYIWQLGFLDGKIGWIISKIMARSVYKRYVYLLEYRKVIKD